MISGLDVIPIRRALGLTEQPLRKNEKAGVGRAQIVLSQEHAAKIYAMRTQNPALPPIAREVVGKSTLVSEVFSVSPKTVRDIWGRKTWTQATRPLWTEQELTAHLGEHSRKQAALLAAATAPKPEARSSKKEAALSQQQAMRPRGRPPGSKDTRPRKRRLRPDDESQDEDMMPQEMFYYQEQLRGRNAPLAYAPQPHPHGMMNTTRMVQHCEQFMHLERGPHSPSPHPPHAHYESSQRRSLEAPRGGMPAWQHPHPHHAPHPHHHAHAHAHPQPPHHHPHPMHAHPHPHPHPHHQPVHQLLPGSDSPRGVPHTHAHARQLERLDRYDDGFAPGRARAGAIEPLYPPAHAHARGEEGEALVCAPLVPEGEGEDCGVGGWVHVDTSSGTSGHSSEDGGRGAWGLSVAAGAEEWGTGGGEFEEVWQEPPQPEAAPRPARTHGMTLRSALQPSAESRMITAAAPPFEIRYVNEAWCDMCQFGVDEVSGATPRILQGPLTDKGAVKEMMERLVTRGEEVTGTLINYKKSGEPFLNRLTMLPLFDDDARVTHYLGVLVDISG